jgi:CSLREA domain-containing protein
VIRGVGEPTRLLDLAENFTLFSEHKSGLIKILAQNHQVLGVNSAIRSMLAAREQGHGRAGVFWQTQGAGKSFSMVFFSQKILRKIEGNWTFVVVTDRTELDDQIATTFKATGAVSQHEGDECHAQSGDELRQLLRGNHRYVFTLIHKFLTPEKLSDRRDIIVLTDEAHRSQYDTLAVNMRAALPNAMFLAFTGTPLIVGEERTRDVFGEYVSIYDFQQSVEDRATVPLFYENRTPELRLKNPKLNEDIYELIEDAELNEEAEKKLERELGRQYHIITRDDRLDKIAKDIVTHFLGRGFQGKAMVVSIDKATALKMHDKVRTYWQEEQDRVEKDLAKLTEFNESDPDEVRALNERLGVLKSTDMALIVSPGQNEIEHMTKLGLDIVPHRRRMNSEQLDEKFKDSDDPLGIAFVCAMWMTGFDAPSCSTVYLDKPMRNHTLMQTIARANRVFPGKHPTFANRGLVGKLRLDGTCALVHNETRRTVKRRILFRSLIGTALLALPVVGFQMLQGDAAQAGGPGRSARPGRPAIIPPPPPIGILFVVDSTGDTHDVSPGDGVCADSNGNCTLRAAIEEVNARANGQDGIAFAIPTTDPGCSGGVCTINVFPALPDLSIAISISGPGADRLTVSSNCTGACYHIFNVTTTGTVAFSGLTIAGAFVSNGNGGGINNASTGTVTVTNSTLRGNSASSGGGISNSMGGTVTVTNSTLSGNSGFGGGIFNSSGGTVTVTNSTLSGNSANGLGGGIFSEFGGAVTVTNSTLSGNAALGGGGGGIFNSGTVNVTNSTFSGNSAFGNNTYFGGGGINNTGTLNITNSTLSGNSANGTGDGGGITNRDTLNVTNSTLSGNSATTNGGGIDNIGGRVSVKSSLIALNTGASSGPDVSGDFFSPGYNLIGKKDGSTGFTAATDLTGTIAAPLDPKLDSNGLNDNGGPTKTIALLFGSPAIDKGTSNGLTGHLTTDQRGAGFARTFDDPNVPNASGGDGTDIGAFEVQSAAPTPTPTPSPTVLGNISTRAFVQTGDSVMIGGLIITGSGQKKVIVRAIGPSLVNHGITNPLRNPTLELHDHTGAVIAFNDNWMNAPNKQEIINSGLAPTNNLESAILTSLNPGNYTAIVRGVNNGTGIALVEGYDLDPTAGSKLGNLSTRALVQTGNNVMIGGFIITGAGQKRVIVRAIGPSLAQHGITNPLLDPTLELHNGNGAVIAFNDNWKDSQQAEIQATGLAPANDLESAIVSTLAPGNYTAIVRGENNTIGVALVEVYGLN